jgi:glycine/D-amino acid oxidase-like deaminating enzyme
VIVVGAGVVGLAAAFEGARDGSRVTVVSADVPGSVQSRGLTRIFRLSHADGSLTDAAARSLELWREWEQLACRPLLEPTGLLLTGDMSDRDVHLQRHGGLELLTGAAHPLAVARDQWWLEATGAATAAEDTVRFLQQDLPLVLAEVTGVDGHGVTLGDGTRIDAERVAVCAGPDTYRLVGLPEPARRRSVRCSFALREPLASPAPCWINRDESLAPSFYAVMDGPDHYSIGLSDAGPATVPEAEQIRAAHEVLVNIVRHAFPGLIPVAERVIVCETTVNPVGPSDGWDLREHGGVVALTGPTLFKFAPLLGRLVAERLAAAPTTVPDGR